MKTLLKTLPLALLILAGCSGGDKTEEATGSSSTASGGSSTASGGEPTNAAPVQAADSGARKFTPGKVPK